MTDDTTLRPEDVMKRLESRYTALIGELSRQLAFAEARWDRGREMLAERDGQLHDSHQTNEALREEVRRLNDRLTAMEAELRQQRGVDGPSGGYRIGASAEMTVTALDDPNFAVPGSVMVELPEQGSWPAGEGDPAGSAVAVEST